MAPRQLSTAQHLVAQHAATTSQTTFVYETTSQAGFGQELLDREYAASRGVQGKVWGMQTYVDDPSHRMIQDVDHGNRTAARALAQLSQAS